MKRILYLLLALALMVAPLTSCNSADVPDEQPPVEDVPQTPSEPSEPTEPTEPEQEEEKKPMTLKVGSYNIGNGSHVRHDLSIIANDIQSQGLDVIGLQEVDRLANRSKNLDTLKLLSEMTDLKYYYYAKAIDLPGNIPTYGQDGEYGIGILSKYPIVEGESYRLSSGGREQRMLARATLDVNGKEINFFTTHLSFEDDKIRAGQLSEIDNIMFDYSFCILTGDFNLRSFEELDVLTGLNIVSNEDTPIVTYSGTDWNTQCIDNVCYSSAFVPGEAYANENNHSDHYMLVAEFEIVK
jgi:endonuclease/exonuclease/phosphatase family metal-dependent hydrolase